MDRALPWVGLTLLVKVRELQINLRRVKHVILQIESVHNRSRGWPYAASFLLEDLHARIFLVALKGFEIEIEVKDNRLLRSTDVPFEQQQEAPIVPLVQCRPAALLLQLDHRGPLS